MESAELRTSHLVVGGSALAREDSGRVVFVSGALPEEVVRVEMRTRKKDFAAGDVSEVLVPSPDRVVPPCAAWHRGCGGCDWQHIDPAAQLRHKTAIVTEALTRTARLEHPEVRAFGSVDPWGYRTTVRVAHSASATGFRSRRSHEVVSIEACPVAARAVNGVLAELATAQGAHRSPAADETVIRTSIATGAVNRSDAAGPQVLFEDVHGVRLRVSLESFFQSSPRAAELLVDAVGSLVGDVEIAAATVVDAYGGIGLFAATVAADAAEVIVVEGSPAACADARVNLAGRRATVVEARVEDWPPRPADLVIADPARAGLDREGVTALAATEAPVFVLVSCDTGSLARDTKLLVAAGYQHQVTLVIDAFVNTSHIETVTRLVRAAAGHRSNS